MALTNHERVGRALSLLNEGLMPFVERELKAEYSDAWEQAAEEAYPDRSGSSGEKGTWDTHKLLVVMWSLWNPIFSRILGHAERSIVSELRETRNQWAHQAPFSTNDAHRALDSITRLLTAVAAPQADAVEQMRLDLLRIQFEEKRRSEMRKASFQPTQGNPQGGLRPWREVVTPHPDVATGRYQQAEFAADLWQVYLGEGSDEYKDPSEFFKRTFLTEGLRNLLTQALQRVSRTGGDPVVELQTNFGGGKTHSMLALYHLFSGTPASELNGVEELLKETGTTIPEGVRRVVIVGTKISPGRTHTKPDGTIVRTLWGEIAWQLGGKEGYEMVREDDEQGTNPGDIMREVFNRYSPCLILIDEWVAYARQLHEDAKLPAGSFDTHFTFAQTLSESAKAAQGTMLLVSIPASDNEIGGQWGRNALDRLKNAIGRVESSWRPASADEGFEIVRRRLFLPLTNEQAVSRDAVARSFANQYKEQSQDFPSECREASYERRIKMAYPIHPELFDRLYTDWSSLDKFQRTRGVLRLMASVIHSLWERADHNLLIMPGTIPIDDIDVQRELTRYLEDQWMPVIEKDVDGPQSLPLTLDNEIPSLGRYSACRRVARTIYIGSAPTIRTSNRGIDDRLIKLGCVQPGESTATFGDALRRLAGKATYLYIDGSRYWYSTQPTVNRLADDRANDYTDDDIHTEIVNRLQEQARYRGDFVKVHVCASSSDIPDEHGARLVILCPNHPHLAKNRGSPACQQALEILGSRGTSPRMYKNTLAFIAPDQSRLDDLKQAARYFLAWSSIWNDREELNLDPFQSRLADTNRRNADETTDIRIPETYQWLLVPKQENPRSEVTWEAIRQQGREHLAPRASRKLRNDEMLLVEMGGERLRHEMDKIPLWRENHVAIKQLTQDFASYLYLPRLKEDAVIYDAIRKGLNILTWNRDTFAYAAGYDDKAQRYRGLNPQPSGYSFEDGQSLLVKPEIAEAQIEAEKPKPSFPKPETPGDTPIIDIRDPGKPYIPTPDEHEEPDTPVHRRYYGSVHLDPMRVNRDVNNVVREVLQHFTELSNANITVTLEINVECEEGFSEKLLRDISENCRVLKFDNFDFGRSE
jgi:hypothetical protein